MQELSKYPLEQILLYLYDIGWEAFPKVSNDPDYNKDNVIEFDVESVED